MLILGFWKHIPISRDIPLTAKIFKVLASCRVCCELTLTYPRFLGIPLWSNLSWKFSDTLLIQITYCQASTLPLADEVRKYCIIGSTLPDWRRSIDVLPIANWLLSRGLFGERGGTEGRQGQFMTLATVRVSCRATTFTLDFFIEVELISSNP